MEFQKNLAVGELVERIKVVLVMLLVRAMVSEAKHQMRRREFSHDRIPRRLRSLVPRRLRKTGLLPAGHRIQEVAEGEAVGEDGDNHDVDLC